MAIVAFDLDGTLVDSLADLHAALCALLAAEGRAPITEVQARVMIGGGARNLLTLAFEATGAPADDATLDRSFPLFLGHYAEILLERTRPYPGAVAALQALRHHTLAVATNKPIAPTERILDGLGLTARFACVVGGDSLPVRKPHRDVLLEVVRRCGGGPAVMVGDSPTDFLAAHNAGLPCVGVRWGYPGPERSEVAPTSWVDDFGALPAAVERLLP